jgi:3-hydroxyacyl-CoA dehydrogenase
VPHPESVIGMHFFNSVHRMPLVEFIAAMHTLPLPKPSVGYGRM